MLPEALPQGGNMKNTKRRASPAAKRRRRTKRSGAISGAALFMRQNFYYLKPESLIRTSIRLACVAA